MRSIITAGAAAAQDHQDYAEPEPYWAEAARREARGEYDDMTGACMTRDCRFDFLIIAAPLAAAIAAAPVSEVVIVATP